MARPDPNAKYTISQFLEIQNSKGEKVVAGGFEKYMLENQFNNEFLGAATMTPTKIMDNGNTLIYNISAFGHVEDYVDTYTQKQIPTVDTTSLYLRNEYQKEVLIDHTDTKTGTDWQIFLNNTLRNLEIAKQDQTNLITIDAIYKTCLATSNYLIIPELSNDTFSVDLKENERLKIVETIAKKVNRITTSRTKYNLGMNKEKLRFIVSPDAGLILLTSKTYTGKGDLAYKDLSSKGVGNGEFLGEILGMPFYNSGYLGQNVLKMVEGTKDSTSWTNNVRDYKFENLAGIVVSPETTILMKKELMLKTFDSLPNSKRHALIHNSWMVNAAMYPQLAHMNFIILSKKPTLEEVNKARAELFAQHPLLFPEFNTPITEAQLKPILEANWRGLSAYK